MKGAAAGQPGQLIFIDFPEPAPQENDLVVQSLVCGICSTDLKFIKQGAKEPLYALGHELVGKISQAPPSSPWKVGQRVALAPYLPCGECYYCQRGQYTLCSRLFEVAYSPGGLAERVLVPAKLAEHGMLPVPDSLEDVTAALAEPLGCVIKGLEDIHLRAGDALLVIGDGPMGQLAAAAGKSLGAGTVIMSGMTPHRLEISRAYFADLVVDVRQTNLKQAVLEVTSQRGADVVMVAVSNAEALQTGLQCVRPGGEVNMFAGVPEGTHLQLDVRSLHYKQYYLTGSFGTAPVYMRKALELLERKDIDYSQVISARYSFEQVGDAVTHMKNYEGLKSVVIFPGAGG